MWSNQILTAFKWPSKTNSSISPSIHSYLLWATTTKATNSEARWVGGRIIIWGKWRDDSGQSESALQQAGQGVAQQKCIQHRGILFTCLFPELNPDEYLNNDLKQTVHGNDGGVARSKVTIHNKAMFHMRHLEINPRKVEKLTTPMCAMPRIDSFNRRINNSYSTFRLTHADVIKM